jgi:hypothetical protein
MSPVFPEIQTLNVPGEDSMFFNTNRSRLSNGAAVHSFKLREEILQIIRRDSYGNLRSSDYAAKRVESTAHSLNKTVILEPTLGAGNIRPQSRRIEWSTGGLRVDLLR